MDIAVITETLASMIRIATPLMLAALGGLLCQRAGVFNIALEGFMLMGAFAGIVFVDFSGGSVWIGFLGAMLIGVMYSGIFALFVTRFKANHIISSIAINILSLGLTSYLLRAMFDVQGVVNPRNINKLANINIPIIKDIPILGAISGQSVVTYFAFIMAIVTYILLFKTEFGLNISAVGESEDAARTAGKNPSTIRGIVILISGALSGLAGAYLSTVVVSQFSEDMVQGRGFTAFTSVVFGSAHPIATSLVTLFFGLADAIGIRIELMGIGISPSIIKMFPFTLAILALAISSYTRKLQKQGVIRLKKQKAK